MPATVVVTKVRLFDTYADTGYRYLAYPVGAEVPASVYERLRSRNAGAPHETPEPDSEPEKQLLEDLTKAQLLVMARELGLNISTRVRKSEIVAVIEEKREAAKA